MAALDLFCWARGAAGSARPRLSIVGTPFYSAAVADFNRDGRLDLATANGAVNSVSVLLGDGHGGFSAAAGSPITVGSSPYSLATGDFNGDGKPDLAVANSGDNTVTVLLGNGNGGFTATHGSPFSVGAHPTSVAVGDFNADGEPDLVTANAFDNTVSVLLDDGSGGFSSAPGSPFAAGYLPLSVAVADFNSDGKLDLAIANEGGDTGNPKANVVTVLLGDGGGGFSPAISSPFPLGGQDPNSFGQVALGNIAVGDFNADGKPDVAVANDGDPGTVSVLLGDGGGDLSPAPGSPFPAGNEPNSVVVGDFNGDGRPDLATANGGYVYVSVLLNTPPTTLITGGPSGTTRQTTATFTFSSNESIGSFQCRLDAGTWEACTSPASYSGLAGIAHTFSVRAISDTNFVDPIGASRSWNIDLATPPVAALQLSPAMVLTGSQVAFDASASHDPLDGTVTDYQWDLNGDGNFDRDTGPDPTTSESYASPGIRHPQVRVTDNAGTSAVATAVVDVRLAPPSGVVGVSIDGGDVATNNPRATLNLVWPAFASTVLVSNDGGFGPAGSTQAFPVAQTMSWTLESSGSERLPKTVYLRFQGAGSDDVPYTDDIILDQTPPHVASAELTGGLQAQSASMRTIVYHVRLTASDDNSGVAGVEFTGAHAGKIIDTLVSPQTHGALTIDRAIPVRVSSRPARVRVRDSAGNWSAWASIGDCIGRHGLQLAVCRAAAQQTTALAACSLLSTRSSGAQAPDHVHSRCKTRLSSGRRIRSVLSDQAPENPRVVPAEGRSSKTPRLTSFDEADYDNAVYATERPSFSARLWANVFRQPFETAAQAQ